MRATIPAAVALSLMLATTATSATDRDNEGPVALRVAFSDLGPDGRLPVEAAFCAPPGVLRHNISPAVRWSAGPPETRSYALLMTDPDVPADLDQIGRPDVVIAENAPRRRFIHWALSDLPVDVVALTQGVDSDGFRPGGKPVGPGPAGVRGANGFAAFMASSPAMAGPYGGYDGPCPPTNDLRPHRYVVTIYALDVVSLGLQGAFTGEHLEEAMAGHILAQGSATAVYDRRGE